ncbi:type II toxin-antitoxin system RelE family toxin [Dissulfuribacter thermophilus]
MKKVKATNLFRLRVGHWRVFFTDSLKIVLIKEVKKRNERTYS